MSKRKAKDGSVEQKASKKKRADPPIYYYDSPEMLEKAWREHKVPLLDTFLSLLRDGYVVVKGVVKPDEVKMCLDDMEKVIQCWPDAKRRPPALHGIMQWGPFGHLRLQEYLRTHAGVTSVFSQFYGCKEEELLSSSDSLCYGVPRSSKPVARKKSNPDAQNGGGWLHMDDVTFVLSSPTFFGKGYNRRGIWCVQGLVALTQQSKDKGCLSVRKGSHLGADAFFGTASRFHPPGARSGDWVRLNQTELDQHYPEEKFPLVHVEAEPGDMVLWFSHCLHQGNVPSTAFKGTTHRRVVVYVCQRPRARLPTAVVSPLSGALVPLTQDQVAAVRAKLAECLTRKQDHFRNHRMTKHCPDEPKLFGIHPRTYGNTDLKEHVETFGATVEKAGLGVQPRSDATDVNVEYLRSMLSESQLARLLTLNGF
jgi:hypothetical protein